MVASYSTIVEVMKVIQRHVDADTLKKIVIDLKKVGGNSSFEQTIDRLYKEVMKVK